MHPARPENKPHSPSGEDTLASHEIPLRPYLPAPVFGYLLEGVWYPSEVTPIIMRDEALFTVSRRSDGPESVLTPLPLSELISGKVRWERMPSPDPHLLNPHTQGLFALSREKILVVELSERPKFYRDLLADGSFMAQSPRIREEFGERSGNGLVHLRELAKLAASYRFCDPSVADSVLEPRYKLFRERHPNLAGIVGTHWREILELVVMPEGEEHPSSLGDLNQTPPPILRNPRGH